MEIKLPWTPTSWQKLYHQTNSTHCCLVGGLGSGKTSAAVVELVIQAIEQPGTLWLVGRKTLPSLRDTILRSFMQWCPPELIKDFNKANLVCKLINGSEIIFRPLDDPEKLKSLEICGFVVEEANEIEEEIYNRLKDRVRQMVKGKKPKYKTTIMLNPTDEDHWIPQLFLHKRPPNHEMFTSTTFDNMGNLPEGYTDELANTYTPEMLQRLLYGKFGRVHTGRPVYPQFSKGNYVASIDYDIDLPVFRSWDFGYGHPACLWSQFKDGQLRVFAEKMGKNIYLDPFIVECRKFEETVFFPKVVSGVLKTIRYLDFCDPRGNDESDKGKSSIQILNEAGIWPTYRRTFIEEGVKAVRNLMDTVESKTRQPNLLIHPRCSILIEGCRGGYALEDGKDKPRKDGYYDHIQDTLRYKAIFLLQRKKIEAFSQAQTRSYTDPRTGYRREY